MKPILVITTLWLIAIAATFLITRNTGLFTYLGPLFLICMIGSIVTIRKHMPIQKS